MASIRVALAQLNFRLGDFKTNVALMTEAYERAAEQQADVVVYSELAVCGYPPEDLLLKQQFLDDARAAVEQIAASTSNAAAVIGFPEVEGESLYNSAAVCHQGTIKGIYRKQLLPNYSVFDEKRYFTSGTSAGPIIEIAGANIGISICEDIWFDEGPIDDQVASGVGLVVSLNASPYQRGKDSDRASTVIDRVARHQIPVVYVNQVGGQDELIFDGSSFVIDSRGEVVARLPQFEETVQVVDLEVEDSGSGDLPVIVASQSHQPKNPIPAVTIPKEEEEVAEVWKALVLATRDYVNKNGFGDVVIGLSGGVDSSLVTAIAVDALGSERVHGVSMPSRYSSQGSKDDAAALAENFGIDFEIIPIEPGYVALTNMLEPVFDGHENDLTEENLQSRLRGVLLMAISNKKGWLVLTTGNKSETSVGYSTLYGDTAGGFAVIKDCPKLLVYELCRWRNKQTSSAWIPEASITKPPSAELRPDQTDDQSLPPYEVLDPLLEAYVERDQTAADLISGGYDPDIVGRITRLVDLSEYKRRQSPPGPRISNKAFGKDRRLPITNQYR
jgi:NAD+ synthase (glutamine-hydrolysing)